MKIQFGDSSQRNNYLEESKNIQIYKQMYIEKYRRIYFK